MKLCKNCGAEVPEDKNFCGACGYKFDKSNSQSQDFSQKAGASTITGADHTDEFDPQDIAANKIYGILACFGILFFIPLVAAPQSKYGRFYANQGLLLAIVSFAIGIVASFISGVLNIFGSIGSIFAIFSLLGGLISMVLGIIPLVLFFIMLINAVNGKAKELPIIGKFRIIN